MTLPSTAERRTRVRLPASLLVEFKLGETVAKGRTGDLSEGGLFIQTPHFADPGATIYLRLHLGPGEPTLKIVGTVTRLVGPGQGSPSGFGVRFDVLYGTDKQTLSRFLTQSLGRELDEESFGTLEDGQHFRFVFEPIEYEGEDDAILPTSPPPPQPLRWPLNIASGEESFTTGDFTGRRRIDDQKHLQQLEFETASPLGTLVLWMTLTVLVCAGGVAVIMNWEEIRAFLAQHF